MILEVLAAVLPLVGGPDVKWSAPSTFIAGQSFKVHVEVTAPKDGTMVANWLFTPSAFTLDGKPLAKREEGGTLSLPPGFTVKGDIDLAPYLQPKGEFKLDYAGDNNASAAPALTVKFFEAAPAGLDFMKMPVEELGDYMVLLQTVRGDILVKFWPETAPGHVRNFLDLSYVKFYDGTTFHRVIPGFMIQGGDPTATGTGDGPRRLKPEFQPTRKHLRGVLSMARSSAPDSASCQFFIMHAAAPSLDNQYSAFGEVVTGLEALDAIVTTPRGAQDKPKETQTILHAVVLKTK